MPGHGVQNRILDGPDTESRRAFGEGGTKIIYTSHLYPEVGAGVRVTQTRPDATSRRFLDGT